MDIKIVPLRLALKYSRKYENSDNTVIKKLLEFSCGYAEEDDFIHSKAISYEDRSKARTYLLINNENKKIISYFSVAIKSIEFNICSKTIKKKLLADEYGRNTCSAYLIGHFAKDSNYKNFKIGKIMLDYVFDLLSEARKIVGGRFIYLDCEKENEKLKKYYQSFGFKYFNESASQMNQYYLKFKSE